MYLDGLDGLDQKIVRLLIENARISYSDIGEEIGLSRVAVKARIQALEQRGIIEEYTTVINPQRNAPATPECQQIYLIELLTFWILSVITDKIKICRCDSPVSALYYP
mgnify:CR=1 FL=1